eukprot:766248-Pleurochrysis_carterae.AAC.2
MAKQDGTRSERQRRVRLRAFMSSRNANVTVTERAATRCPRSSRETPPSSASTTASYPKYPTCQSRRDNEREKVPARGVGQADWLRTVRQGNWQRNWRADHRSIRRGS